MREDTFRKMRYRKIILRFSGNRNNGDDKIAEYAIWINDMQVCSGCGSAVKFLFVTYTVNFFTYCRNKKNSKEEN